MITLKTPQRGTDKHGCGAYHAPRGNRLHNGEDLAAWPGSFVIADELGNVTKIGYPYNPTDPKKGHLRFVELTTQLGYRLRYFYIEPLVCVGDSMAPGHPLGTVQDLQAVFGPDMTPHIHLEVIHPDGDYMDPKLYF